jgi:hypothetical protein
LTATIALVLVLLGAIAIYVLSAGVCPNEQADPGDREAWKKIIAEFLPRRGSTGLIMLRREGR